MVQTAPWIRSFIVIVVTIVIITITIVDIAIVIIAVLVVVIAMIAFLLVHREGQEGAVSLVSNEVEEVSIISTLLCSLSFNP